MGLDELDFEILTPGSRGVLGMGAEPARIVAAPRTALGGAAPKREAAAAVPLPAPTDRGPRRDDRPPRRDDRAPARRPAPRRPTGDGSPGRPARATRRAHRSPARRCAPPDAPRRDDARTASATAARAATTAPGGRTTGPRAATTGPRAATTDRARPRSPPARLTRSRPPARSSASARSSRRPRRHPRRSTPGKRLLEQLMQHMGFSVAVNIETGGDESAQRDRRGRRGARGARRADRPQGRAALGAPAHREPDAVARDGRVDARPRRRRGVPRPPRAAAPRRSPTGPRRASSRQGRCSSWSRCPPWSGAGSTSRCATTQAVGTQSIGEEPNRRVVVVPKAVGLAPGRHAGGPSRAPIAPPRRDVRRGRHAPGAPSRFASSLLHSPPLNPPQTEPRTCPPRPAASRSCASSSRSSPASCWRRRSAPAPCSRTRVATRSASTRASGWPASTWAVSTAPPRGRCSRPRSPATATAAWSVTAGSQTFELADADLGRAADIDRLIDDAFAVGRFGDPMGKAADGVRSLVRGTDIAPRVTIDACRRRPGRGGRCRTAGSAAGRRDRLGDADRLRDHPRGARVSGLARSDAGRRDRASARGPGGARPPRADRRPSSPWSRS